jgi:lambda repressor-like predicted transcriptional regulator
MTPSVAQILEARRLLGWTPREFAEKAGLSHSTIRKLFKRPMKDETRARIIAAMKDAGTVFNDEIGSDKPAVWLNGGQRRSVAIAN